MKVYQLKLTGTDIILDPVFKTRAAAAKFKEKYKNRKLEIIESILSLYNLDSVYRIKTIDSDGAYLEDSIFDDKSKAELTIAGCDNKEVVSEYFYENIKNYLEI